MSMKNKHEDLYLANLRERGGKVSVGEGATTFGEAVLAMSASALAQTAISMGGGAFILVTAPREVGEWVMVTATPPGCCQLCDEGFIRHVEALLDTLRCMLREKYGDKG